MTLPYFIDAGNFQNLSNFNILKNTVLAITGVPIEEKGGRIIHAIHIK